MTERLEEIKHYWYIENMIDKEDVGWLIQQAERVQELEELVTAYQTELAIKNNALKRAKNKNKRYREVIKKAIDDLENECLWDALITLKALEGEE